MADCTQKPLSKTSLHCPQLLLSLAFKYLAQRFSILRLYQFVLNHQAKIEAHGSGRKIKNPLNKITSSNKDYKSIYFKNAPNFNTTDSVTFRLVKKTKNFCSKRICLNPSCSAVLIWKWHFSEETKFLYMKCPSIQYAGIFKSLFIQKSFTFLNKKITNMKKQYQFKISYNQSKDFFKKLITPITIMK